MTGDEADVQGQSKGEESLSQRLPISYSLLDPQPQRQRTAVALQGLRLILTPSLPLIHAYSQKARLGFPIQPPLQVISLQRGGLLSDFLIFLNSQMCGSKLHSM